VKRSRHQVITSAGCHHGSPLTFICAFFCISLSTGSCTAFCSFFCTLFHTVFRTLLRTVFSPSRPGQRSPKAQGKAALPAGAGPPAVILSGQDDRSTTSCASHPATGLARSVPSNCPHCTMSQQEQPCGPPQGCRVGLHAAPDSGFAARRQVLPGLAYLAGGASGAGLPSRGGPLRSPWRMCSIFSQRWRSILACSASKIFCCSGESVA